MTNLQKSHVRQHYIPQFILKNFCYDQSKSKVYFFENGESEYSSLYVSDVFMEKYFYSKEENSLKTEESLASFEADVAPIFKKLKNDTEINLSFEEDERLRIFLSLLAFRTVGTKEQFKNMSEASKELYRKASNDINMEDIWLNNVHLISKCRKINEIIKKQGNTLAEYLNLITIPMITELTNEILKSDSYKPTSKRAGKSLMTIPLYSQDDRGVEILKKVDPQGDHDHYDFVSVTKDFGAILPGIGATNGINVYTINSKGISETLICAQRYRGGHIDDPIGESLLNGEEGKTYEVFRDAYKYFEFSENVIYDFNGLLPSTETN